MEEYTAIVPDKKHAKKSKDASTKLVAIVIGAIVVAALGFLGGVQYQKHHSGSVTAVAGSVGVVQNGGGFGGGRMRRAGGFGTVTAVGGSSVTVQNSRTGASTMYAITSSTKILNAGATAAVTDIQIGATVIVQTSSSDTKTATQIDINPNVGGFAGAGSSNTIPSANNSGSASVN